MLLTDPGVIWQCRKCGHRSDYEEAKRHDCTTASQAEITPEMVQVGVERLYKYDPDYSDSEKTVREIFLVMTAARQWKANAPQSAQ